MDYREEWSRAAQRLTRALKELGYPEEFSSVLIKSLQNPKAIGRMASYVEKAKPKNAEMIADEMLAIQSEIESWRNKKASEKANAGYNAWLEQRRYLEEED